MKTENKNRTIITVVGMDAVGIIAKICTYLSNNHINVLDISQTIVDGFFNMVMVVDLSEPSCSFDELQDNLNRLGTEVGVQIRIQKSEIFEAMHQI